MKIAFVAPHAAPLFLPDIQGGFGGAEVQQMLLARYLRQQGHEVTVLVGRSPDVESPVQVDGIGLVPFAMRWAGGSKAYLVPDLVSLLAAIRRTSADVYLIKLPRILLAPLGTMVRTVRGKLVFWLTSDRDVDLADAAGMGGRAAKSLYRFGLRFPHAAIAQNGHQLARCLDFGLPARHLPSLVRMGDSDWWAKKTEPRVVLWVGSYGRRSLKHPEHLFWLAGELPETRFRMVVTTDTEATMRRLEEQAAGLDNVDFQGAVPFDEIPRHYADASVFLSTSGLEGFPNTFLQAWASGTPVASLEVNPYEAVSRHNLGVCAEGDLAVLRDRLRGMVQNPAELKLAGERGRRYIAGTHWVNTVGPDYLRFLEQVAAGEVPRPVSIDASWKNGE